MNYINEKAQLVTVEGDIREDKYAIISSTKWTQILRSIHRNKSSDLFSAISPRVDFKPLAFQLLLKLNSVPLVFDMSGLQFTKLVNYVNSSEVEHIGYIVFDNNLCKVYFEVDDTAQSTAIETVVNYLPGYSFKGRNNTVVISTIHTHPEERKYRKLGVTDQQLFDAQYRKDIPDYMGADGYSGIARRAPHYSMGIYNVDYYSVGGKRLSKNNICTNHSLISGAFNILKHALHEYITYHY